MTQSNKPLSYSFPALTQAGADILILGSMPGIESLRQQQYYAHPRNVFWPIMQALFDVDATTDYSQRCLSLTAKGVAVWDVLKACYRPGSLDHHIDPDTIEANDFPTFFTQHPQIQAIFFNGMKAEVIFKRYVLPQLTNHWRQLPQIVLPSTSPAHATLNLDQKTAIWREKITAFSLTGCTQ